MGVEVVPALPIAHRTVVPHPTDLATALTVGRSGTQPDSRADGQGAVRWKYLGKEFDMEFIGGLLGIRQASDTLCLTPEIGWAVRKASSSRVRRRSETYYLDFNRLFCIGDRR